VDTPRAVVEREIDARIQERALSGERSKRAAAALGGVRPAAEEVRCLSRAR